MLPRIILDPKTLHLLEQMLCQSSSSNPGRRAWEPPTDVFELDDAVVIRVEIAGVQAEEIQIQATDSLVVVSGQRADAAKGLKRRVNQMEMSYGPFERVIPLSEAVQVDRAHASYEAGILELHLPKASRRESHTIGVRIQLG